MNPAISIIVPVYRAEKYLPDCIESLMAQTFTDIEIILVDDGSPDASGAMCDEYVKKDPRIRVIHQSNQGVSVARNNGIDAAAGKYLMFVDSDDWVNPDFCRLPYEVAEKHGADCIMFKYIWVENGKYEQQSDFEDGVKSNYEAMCMMDQGVGIGPCNKLFRRELFAGIRFPEGRRYEDIVVLPKLLQAANAIYYINTPLHYYRGNSGSSTHSYSHKANKDMFEMCMERIRMLKEWGYKDLADISWKWPCWTYLVREGRHSEHSDAALNYIRTIPGGADNFPGSKKIMYILLMKAPFIFDSMCILMGRRAKE